MKAALAACLLTVVAVVVVFAVIVSGNKDHAPDEIRACATDLTLPRIISVGSLGQARADLERGTLRVERQVALDGGTQASILVPPDRTYTMVALTQAPQSPQTVLTRISTAPEGLVSLFRADDAGTARALRACVTERAK